MSSTTGERITRDDLEAKFRELEGEVEEVGEQARDYALIAGGVIVVAVVAVAFLMGRRRGKKTATVVEIRRI